MKMFKKLWFMILVFLVLSSTVFCYNYEEEFHKTVKVKRGSAVEIHNITGNITISKGQENSVDILAIKKSSKSKNELKKVGIRITTGDRLRIETEYYTSNANVGVDYEIKVPAGVQLSSVQNVTGNINITGVDECVEVKTVTGNITTQDAPGIQKLECVTGSIKTEIFGGNNNSVKVKIITGNIDAYIQPDLNANLDADIITGNIYNHGLSINFNEFSGRHLSGTIGKGGYGINFETVTGNINFYKL
jgi:hypothetical protein